MRYKVIVEPEAVQDLLGIKRYITEQDSITKSVTFISELKKSINTLVEMPHRCRKSLYTDDENVHDMIYKSYTIVFKIIDTNVHILTIFRQREYKL